VLLVFFVAVVLKSCYGTSEVNLDTVLSIQDVQLRVLRTQIRATDFLEALQNFPSPLNYSHILGDLLYVGIFVILFVSDYWQFE